MIMKILSEKRRFAVLAALAFGLIFSFSSMAALESRAEDEAAGPGSLIQAETAADDSAAPDDEPEIGPGFAGSRDDDSETPKQGESLGIFTTTGYCNCPLCGGGSHTYSGTVPKGNHTIAADLDVLPMGTKVMIDGTVYTVEDIGGAVKGRIIDIYYDNHDAAVAHGMQQQEVFAVSEE